MKVLLSFLVVVLALATVNAEADVDFISLNDLKSAGHAAFGAFKHGAQFAKNIFDKTEDDMAKKYCSWPNYQDPKTRYLQSLAAQVALDIVYNNDAHKFNPTKEAGWNQGWHNDVFVVGGELRLLVLHNEKDKTAIMSIAGTRPVPADWAGLAETTFKKWSKTEMFKGLPGSTHTGMYEKIVHAWRTPAFVSLASKLLREKYSIIISGHSQGGGHAGILGGQLHYYAKHHVKAVEPYYLQILTFGSVRPGDKHFAQYISENIKYITRVRHKMDAASAYPPPGVFYHVGKRMLFNCLHTPLHCHSSTRYLKNFLTKMGTTKVIPVGANIKDNCKGTCWNGVKCRRVHG
jgi:hypothetical protein